MNQNQPLAVAPVVDYRDGIYATTMCFASFSTHAGSFDAKCSLSV